VVILNILTGNNINGVLFSFGVFKMTIVLGCFHDKGCDTHEKRMKKKSRFLNTKKIEL